MPRGTQKYRGPFGAMPGPLYNTEEGEAGGGGAATKTDPKPEPPAGEKPDEGDKGRKGGQAQILADLASERDKRQAIETQLTTIQTALASAFGIDAGKQPSAEELVGDVQKQLAAMQHQSLVDRVARVHGITESDDLEFLASAKDEEQMSRFAARLKVATAPGTPKPDGSQGAKGDSNKPDPGPGIARLSAAFEDEFNK